MPNPPKTHLIEDTEPRYRSGAAARMARMPVATLRTWERRFQVVAPLTEPSGHRLYSAADVHRLTLLKQLSDMGHSISHLAALSIEQLREVATTHATIQARTLSSPGIAVQAAATPAPWRVVVVGPALARRLQGKTVRQRLGREVELIGPFASLAACLAAAPHQIPGPSSATLAPAAWGSRDGPDLLLVGLPSMQDDQATGLRQLADAWHAEQAAVLCTYGMPSACDAARRAGFAVQRGALGDDALADWLRWLGDPYAGTTGPVTIEQPAPPDAPWALPGPPRPRRFDDTTLADFAALSSAVACECPRHVSELLILLSAFEDYSAECVSLSTVDADLHRYLQRAAASARAILEIAMERIALHEGLVLKA
jgi:DNA-binding transcriptional MerR regulator